MAANKQMQLQARVQIAMPLHEFWLALSNTNRLNPSVGIPAIKFTPVSAANGTTAYMDARTRYLGVPVHWREMAFEWQEDDFFWVERQLIGPVARLVSSLTSGVQMRAIGPEQTAVEFFGTADTPSALGRLAYRLLVGRKFLADIVKTSKLIERNYQQREQMAYLLPPPGKPHVNRRLLFSLTAQLRERGVTAEVVSRLSRHLATAPDDEVVQMRAFALADDWDLPRMVVLSACLQAAHIGLLDATWEVMCPNCRVSKITYSTLSDLQPTAHCDTCNIRYDVTFDQYVEMRFNVGPAVRKTDERAYCVGGPYLTRHVLAQLRLAAGAERELEVRLPAARYRLRLRQCSGHVALTLNESAPISVNLSFDGSDLSGAISLTPTGTLHLSNQTAGELLVIVEQEAWDEQATSAALVTSLQEFRKLFSSEVLSPGTTIAVRNLTFMFTDLKNSTGLYEMIGDSSAYARVRDHFSVLAEAVAVNDGSLVKTMGDAVMAVFTKPIQAVAAALAIQTAIADFNRQREFAEPVTVKLGLHNGPCLAVNANDTLDYFGTTVNIAARLQSLSRGGDLVVSAGVYEDADAHVLLTAYPAVSATVPLRGITDPISIYHVDVDRQPVAPILPSSAKMQAVALLQVDGVGGTIAATQRRRAIA